MVFMVKFVHQGNYWHVGWLRTTNWHPNTTFVCDQLWLLHITNSNCVLTACPQLATIGWFTTDTKEIKFKNKHLKEQWIRRQSSACPRCACALREWMEVQEPRPRISSMRSHPLPQQWQCICDAAEQMEMRTGILRDSMFWKQIRGNVRSWCINWEGEMSHLK